MSGLALLTAPAAEPLTLAEAKSFLRVATDADDALIAGLITAARRTVEEMTGRALMTQSWRLTLDHWPEAPIRMPRPPLRALLSATHVGADGAEIAMALGEFWVDTASDPGRVVLLEPYLSSALRPALGLRLEFSAGYGDTAQHVPEPLRQAIQLLIAAFYENRGEGGISAETGRAIAALIDPFRARRLA
ncbi:MAG: phage head-tail connector protein [Alphaproteobacteria bacterium]|nr:phage head-tail connector protein [Alphaproteobacteria bacterium]